jgi:hypothetical protein
MTKSLYDDAVVTEIHAIRQAMLEACDGDMDEYRHRVLEHQRASGRKIIRKPFRERRGAGQNTERTESGRHRHR